MSISKSILYICLGTITLKETENAVHFALNLKRAGFSNHFLAFPFNARFIKQYGFSVDELKLSKEENYRIFTEVCKRVKPDWILIADGYLFDFWFGPKHIFDMRWILDNPVGAHFATFDNLCLSMENTTLPFYNNPNIEDKFKWLHTTDLTSVMPLLIPCPYAFSNAKFKNKKSSIFYYRRYKERLKWDENQKKNFRNSIGLEMREKLVLFSLLEWPLQVARVITEDLDIWLKHFSQMIEIIFQEVKEKTTLLVISPYPLFTNFSRRHLKIINWDLLSIDIYTKFLLTADLFITTSAISHSIIQAVINKVPAGCLISSGSDFRENKEIPSQLLNWFEIGQKRYPDLLKPYLIFPIGWQEILAPILEKNPYADTFKFLDLLNPGETINTINDLLFNSEKKKSLIQRQENYMEQIAFLPGPEKIMKSLMENS